MPPTSSSSTWARPPSPPRCSRSSPSARSSSAPAPRASTSTSTSATCGCARSRSSARTSPTPTSAIEANELIESGQIRPVLWRTLGFEGVPEAHQLMRDNKHLGKIAILVGAETEGEGKTAEGPGAIYAEVGAMDRRDDHSWVANPFRGDRSPRAGGPRPRRRSTTARRPGASTARTTASLDFLQTATFRDQGRLGALLVLRGDRREARGAGRLLPGAAAAELPRDPRRGRREAGAQLPLASVAPVGAGSRRARRGAARASWSAPFHRKSWLRPRLIAPRSSAARA